ncbi:unnamed protein product [Prunus armeniaca]
MEDIGMCWNSDALDRGSWTLNRVVCARRTGHRCTSFEGLGCTCWLRVRPPSWTARSLATWSIKDSFMWTHLCGLIKQSPQLDLRILPRLSCQRACVSRV